MVENYYSRYFVLISRLVRLLDEVALLCPKVVFDRFLFCLLVVYVFFVFCFVFTHPMASSVASIVTQRTGARIRLSQNREFYPGTSDRVLAGR